MAGNLIWKDLSAKQLDNIRHPHPKKGFTGRDLLAKFLGISNPNDEREAINLDLYVHTLQFGESQKFADDKLSGLFSLVKAVHLRTIGEKLTVERSFTFFKDLLLSHSVQRPPYSVGLFTFTEMKKITDWMLDTYYRHFKLYQYCFTDRVTMTVRTVHPLDSIESVPALQPLDVAITEEQHQAQLTEEQRKQEEEDARAREQAALDAEAARQSRLREEYEASIPEEIKEQVAQVLARELELLRTKMEEQFNLQQTALKEKITALEARVGGAAAKPGAAK